jgi:lipoprotein NlpD
MCFHQSKLNVIVLLMVLALFNACTNQPNYAPVTTGNKDITEEGQHPPKANPDLGKSNQHLNIVNQDRSKGSRVVTEDLKKFHLVKNGETLYTIGMNSGYGYQRLALWNHIPPPYNIMTGKKIKFFDPGLTSDFTLEKQLITAVEKVSIRSKKTGNSFTNKTNVENSSPHKKPQTNLAGKKQQKSIETIDNKKIFELNFGWPVKGRVLNGFSPSHNKGIDIAGKKGQPIKATEAGKVVYGGQGLIGFGQLLIIKHDDVYLSAYANNSRLLVNEGQQVEKGQIIAEIGNVGINQTSLHFEIRKNGKPVNPLKLLPKR